MLPRKSYITIASILILGAVLVASCATTVMETPAPTPTTTPTTETTAFSTPAETTTTPSTKTEEPVDEFATWWDEYRQPFTVDTSGYCSFYRGAWGTRLDELRSYLLNAAKLREGGFDTIMVEAEIVLDRETHEPKSIGEEIFIFYLQALKREGFRIILIPNPMHPNLDMGLGYAWEETDTDAYYHPDYELIKKFDGVVIKWARTAEEYGVDAFLPVLEPFKLAGDHETASQWLQEILPRIREAYHGDVWATDIMYDIGQGLSVPYPYDYSGYDFLLSGPPAGRKDTDEWEEVIRVFIEKGMDYVNDYGLKGFGLYEYGGYTGGIWYEDVQMEIFDQILSQEQAADIAEALVRQANGKLKASFPRISVGWQDFDTLSYGVITDWYNSLGENISPIESGSWTYEQLIEIEQKLGGDEYRDIFDLSSS
jgi:hypothetical protein